MEVIQRNMPQLRYLFYYIKKNKRVAYLKYARREIIECLWQITLNLTYSNINGIQLTKAQIKLLLQYKAGLKKVLYSKTTAEKRKSLTVNIIDVLLTVFISWMSKRNHDGNSL